MSSYFNESGGGEAHSVGPRSRLFNRNKSSMQQTQQPQTRRTISHLIESHATNPTIDSTHKRQYHQVAQKPTLTGGQVSKQTTPMRQNSPKSVAKAQQKNNQSLPRPKFVQHPASTQISQPSFFERTQQPHDANSSYFPIERGQNFKKIAPDQNSSRLQYYYQPTKGGIQTQKQPQKQVLAKIKRESVFSYDSHVQPIPSAGTEAKGRVISMAEILQERISKDGNYASSSIENLYPTSSAISTMDKQNSLVSHPQQADGICPDIEGSPARWTDTHLLRGSQSKEAIGYHWQESIAQKELLAAVQSIEEQNVRMLPDNQRIVPRNIQPRVYYDSNTSSKPTILTKEQSLKERPRSVLTGTERIQVGHTEQQEKPAKISLGQQKVTPQTHQYYESSVPIGGRGLEPELAYRPKQRVVPPHQFKKKNNIKIIGAEQQLVRVSRHLDNLSNQVQDLIASQARSKEGEALKKSPAQHIEPNVSKWVDIKKKEFLRYGYNTTLDRYPDAMSSQYETKSGKLNVLNVRRIQKQKKQQTAAPTWHNSQNSTSYTKPISVQTREQKILMGIDVYREKVKIPSLQLVETTKSPKSKSGLKVKMTEHGEQWHTLSGKDDHKQRQPTPQKQGRRTPNKRAIQQQRSQVTQQNQGQSLVQDKHQKLGNRRKSGATPKRETMASTKRRERHMAGSQISFKQTKMQKLNRRNAQIKNAMTPTKSDTDNSFISQQPVSDPQQLNQPQKLVLKEQQLSLAARENHEPRIIDREDLQPSKLSYPGAINFNAHLSVAQIPLKQPQAKFIAPANHQILMNGLSVDSLQARSQSLEHNTLTQQQRDTVFFEREKRNILAISRRASSTPSQEDKKQVVSSVPDREIDQIFNTAEDGEESGIMRTQTEEISQIAHTLELKFRAEQGQPCQVNSSGQGSRTNQQLSGGRQVANASSGGKSTNSRILQHINQIYSNHVKELHEQQRKLAEVRTSVDDLINTRPDHLHHSRQVTSIKQPSGKRDKKSLGGHGVGTVSSPELSQSQMQNSKNSRIGVKKHTQVGPEKETQVMRARATSAMNLGNESELRTVYAGEQPPRSKDCLIKHQSSSDLNYRGVKTNGKQSQQVNTTRADNLTSSREDPKGYRKADLKRSISQKRSSITQSQTSQRLDVTKKERITAPSTTFQAKFKANTLTPLKSNHQPLTTKKEFIEKFNRLISYDYQDQLINVEQSLDDIRRTIMRHNKTQQNQRKSKDGGREDETQAAVAGQKSTLKQQSKIVGNARMLPSKFSTINSQRQKRVSFMINTEMESAPLLHRPPQNIQDNRTGPAVQTKEEPQIIDQPN